MRVYAPAPFRYPAQTGKDYPFGYQDVADDTLARTLVASGLVFSTDPSVGGTNSSFSTVLLNGVLAGGAGPSFTWPGGTANLTINCASWNGAVAAVRYSTDGGSTWNPLPGDWSSFSANGGGTITATLGWLIDMNVVGTPGAAMTATVSR